MTKALTLALGLDEGTVPKAEQDAGLERRLADGLHITTGANYSSDLGYSTFGQSYLSGLATYFDANNKAPDRLSTAEFKNIHAVAGETVSITYQYKNVSTTKNNDFAFAVFGTSPIDTQQQPLARSDQAQAYHYTDGTTYATSFTVNKTGDYSLFLANGDDGTTVNPADLVVKSITVTTPDSGAGAYTVTPSGIALADGSLILPNGSLALPGGSTLPSVFSGGSQQIVSAIVSHDGGGLIGQDGGGLIGQDGGGVISNDGAGAVSAPGASLLSQDGAGVVSNDGAGIVSHDGGGIISHDGGGVISNDGASLIAVGGGNFRLTSLQFKQVSLPLKPATVQPAVTLAAPSPLGGDIRVGTAGPTGTNQNDPSAAGLSDGRLAAVWSDNTATAGGTFAVRGEILNPDGTAAGAPFLVSTDGASDQTGASVTGLPNGGFAVSWLGTSVGTDGHKSAPDVHLQIYDASGAKVGNEQRVGFAQDPRVSAMTDLFETGAGVASLWDGGFVLTFQAQDQGSSAKTGAAVRFDKTGKRVTSSGLGGVQFVGDQTSGSSSQTDLAATGLNGSAGFAVAYRQLNPSAPDQEGIYLDVFDASGNRTQSQLHVNTSTLGPQGQPGIATLANGDVAVAWLDPGDAQGAGLATLRAQIVDPTTGAKVGPEIKIANTLAGGDPPAVTALHDGTFQVTWDAPSVKAGTITGLSLQSQLFSADGKAESPIFDVGTPSATDAYREQTPSVVQLAGGTIAAVGRRGDGLTSGIQADLLSTTGQTASVHQAPSGQDGIAYAIRGFQRATPYGAVNARTFQEHDFGFSGADGAELAGVKVTTLPDAGTLYDDGKAVAAGQTISVADIDSGKFYFETGTADKADHSFTFQVVDTGSAAYGGANTDPNPHKLTLRYDAPPVLGGVSHTVQATAGGSVVLAPDATVSDPDDATLSGAGVSISPDGYVIGDTLSVADLSAADLAAGATVPGTAITAKINADPEHKFYSLLFTGDDTAAHYEAALSSVSYSFAGSSAATGATGSRTIYFDVGDPHGNYNEGYPNTVVSFGAPAPSTPSTSTTPGVPSTPSTPTSGGSPSGPVDAPPIAAPSAAVPVAAGGAGAATGPALPSSTAPAAPSVPDTTPAPASISPAPAAVPSDPVPGAVPSGPAPDPYAPVTVQGADGTVTTTVLSPDGTVSTSSLAPDGTASTTTQSPDGTTRTSFATSDGTLITVVANPDGTSATRTEGGPGFDGLPYSALTDLYAADGSLLVEVRDRDDGSHGVIVGQGGQTLPSSSFDVFFNRGAPDSAFVFDPGYGLDVVRGLVLRGDGHSTLDFAGTDFSNDIAEVLRSAHNVAGGVEITDPTSGDSVRLMNVTKRQLIHNQQDITFH